MSGNSIELRIQGIGHVPSFKNRKRICGKRLVTDKRTAVWMRNAAASFESQLRFFFRTRGIEIQTGQPALSSIACWIPLDDSARWIDRLSVQWQIVPKGEEGAIIRIETVP